MSPIAARHRKPEHSAATHTGAPSRHRRNRPPSRRSPRLLVLATSATAVCAAIATAIALSLHTAPVRPVAGQTTAQVRPVKDALGTTLANGVALAMNQLPVTKATPAPTAKPIHRTSTHRRQRVVPAVRHTAIQRRRIVVPVYLNPLRSIAGLLPERIDMGADFGGSGPIYAIGNAVITNATATSPGWPGGGWITYQLTSGPAAGLVVYVAEDVVPTVQVGQKVTPYTAIANMYNGSAGIETGWAMPNGASAESQLPVAGGISGGGPFPTDVGVSFDALLQALGVPAAPNAGQQAYGVFPPGYLTTWTGLTKTTG